jgi:hypothetical protein
LHAEQTACTVPLPGEVESEVPEIKGPGIQVFGRARRQVEPAIVDCDLTPCIQNTRKPQHAEKIAGVLRYLFFGAIAALLLLWVALFNGYPTVYPDTGGYLYTALFHIELPPFRAPGYSAFIEQTGQGGSAWFTIAMQAILVITVLSYACRYLLGGKSRFRANCLLAIAAGLAALTSLPWEVSQLMPDVFAGVVFLCAFLLAFDDRLGVIGRIVLSGILIISVSAHLSLLPIGLLFVAVMTVTRLADLRLQEPLAARTVLAWLLLPVIPIAAAGFWTASMNRNMGLGYKVSVSGNEFFLASLFGNGLAADYLHESCPRKPYIACRHLTNLPATPGEFLFWNPLLREMAGHEDEIQELARETVVTQPLKFAMITSKDTLLQFARIRTGDEIRETNAPNTNGIVIQQIFPQDSQAFANSRQVRGRLWRLTNIAAVIDIAAFWLSALGCLYFARTRRMEKLNLFFYSTIAFLLINAAVCSTFAGVFDRYQSRVAWLVPFCLMAYVCAAMKERSGNSQVRIG